MSRRSSSQHHPRNHSPPPQDALASRSAGLSLVHAGRQLRIGPIAFWVVVGTLVIMAVWTITTATYFAFREDVLTRLIARQAEMQFGYEDRIAELRAQVDRFSSRQLLDQEQYEQKLDQILRRQTALESRASALNGLGDTTGAIRPPARGGWAGEPRAIPLKPSHDKGAFVVPLDRTTIDPRSGILAKGARAIGGIISPQPTKHGAGGSGQLDGGKSRSEGAAQPRGADRPRPRRPKAPTPRRSRREGGSFHPCAGPKGCHELRAPLSPHRDPARENPPP